MRTRDRFSPFSCLANPSLRVGTPSSRREAEPTSAVGRGNRRPFIKVRDGNLSKNTLPTNVQHVNTYIHPLPTKVLDEDPNFKHIEELIDANKIDIAKSLMCQQIIDRIELNPWASLVAKLRQYEPYSPVVAFIESHLQVTRERIGQHVRVSYLTTSENEGVQPAYGVLLHRAKGVFVAHRYGCEGNHVTFQRLDDRNVRTIDEAKEIYRNPGSLESSLHLQFVVRSGEPYPALSFERALLPYVAEHVLSRR